MAGPVPAMEEALGTVCWWGLSPAIDLRLHREHDPPATPGPPAPLTPPGNGDAPRSPLGHRGGGGAAGGGGRGAARTADGGPGAAGTPPGHHRTELARGVGTEGVPGGGPGCSRSHPPQLFVAERRPESVSRQLLFLLLATEAPGRVSAAGNGTGGTPPNTHRDPPGTGTDPAPPPARAAAILELLGSVRVRPGTAAALPGAAARLRRWVTANRDPDGPAELELMKVRAGRTGGTGTTGGSRVMGKRGGRGYGGETGDCQVLRSRGERGTGGAPGRREPAGIGGPSAGPGGLRGVPVLPGSGGPPVPGSQGGNRGRGSQVGSVPGSQG